MSPRWRHRARAPELDGIGPYLGEVVTLSDAEPVDVAQVLRDTKAHVLINLLPVGSEEAVKFYAEQALAAGCGFVNCIRCSSPASRSGVPLRGGERPDHR